MLLFIYPPAFASHCNDALFSINRMHVVIASKRSPLNFHPPLAKIDRLFGGIALYLYAGITPKTKRIYLVALVITS